MTRPHDPASRAGAAPCPLGPPIPAARLRALSLLVSLIASACAPASPPPPVAPAAPAPLVDGDCGEYTELAAELLIPAPGVELHLHQDRHYVWLCAALPPESFGIADLRLEAPRLAEPLNLHVSAQLGEWAADRPEAAPQGPDDDLWWEIDGWTANPLRFHGLDRSSEPVRARFRRARARELQLAKARFGRGEWRFALALAGLRDPAGGLFAVDYPADGSLHVLTVD